MIDDTDHPYMWFDDCVSLGSVCREAHIDSRYLLRILETDSQVIYRFPFGKRHRYLIPRRIARSLILVHGSEAARAFRKAHKAIKLKGVPLWQACSRCGKKGRQWRQGITKTGSRRVHCGHCRRSYMIGGRAPLQSTCIHCGSTVHQRRYKHYASGNLRVLCADCGKCYTLKPDPDIQLSTFKPSYIPPRPPDELW